MIIKYLFDMCMKNTRHWMLAAILLLCCVPCVQAQVMKAADLEAYAKALVMTHAYSNAIMDKVEEALKNGLVGNDDDDW